MVDHSHHQQHTRLRADYRIPAIEKYAYCLCLHVKPTTIFIAVFKLIRALLFASILLNTEFAVSEHGDIGLTVDTRHQSTAAAVNILARIIMASVSAVGIYAVISGRAALLMPLYAILLVDFFFSLPAFYNRDSDPSFSSDHMGDLRAYPSPTNSQYTRYSIMLFSTLMMIIKIYFLCVIWKCYRYLRLIELVSPIIYPPYQGGPCPIRIIGRPDQDGLADVVGGGNNISPPPYESIASSMKPPNYEEAMKATTESTCPSYNPAAAAMGQPQQHVVLTSINPDQQLTLQHEQHQPRLSSDSIAIAITGSPDASPSSISNTATNSITAGASSQEGAQHHQVVVATSPVQKPQDMTGSAVQQQQQSANCLDTTVEKSPSSVTVDPRESCDKQ